MSWTISAWAVGRHRTTNAEQAVRIQIKRDEHDINEEFGLRGDASGIYRRSYGDWAANVGSGAVNEAGEAGQPVIPPGELVEDGLESSYTVPDEALPPEELEGGATSSQP